MAVIKLRRLPTGLLGSDFTCSSSSGPDMEDETIHSHNHRRLVIVRNRPKYYTARMHESSKHIDASLVAFYLFAGAMAGVLLLTGLFMLAWRNYRKKQAQRRKEGRLELGEMSIRANDYQPIRAKDVTSAKYNTAP